MRRIDRVAFEDKRGGTLEAWEGVSLGFSIERTFCISANGQVGTQPRGKHAHLNCKQAIFVLAGRVQIACRNSDQEVALHLTRECSGIYVPPLTWVEFTLLTADSIVQVLCDRVYEPEDYITDLNELKTLWTK